MRVLILLLLSAVMAGAAGASSFVVAPAPRGKTTTSMVAVDPPFAAPVETTPSDNFPPQGIDPTVTLSYPFVEGEPPRDLAIVAPPADLKQISPSLMVMEVRPEDRIAAAKESQGRAPLSQPMVFRGGIVGDAFATPAQSDQPQLASDAKPPVAASDAKAPSQPEPVAPPSPSPAGPTRAPE